MLSNRVSSLTWMQARPFPAVVSLFMKCSEFRVTQIKPRGVRITFKFMLLRMDWIIEDHLSYFSATHKSAGPDLFSRLYRPTFSHYTKQHQSKCPPTTETLVRLRKLGLSFVDFADVATPSKQIKTHEADNLLIGGFVCVQPSRKANTPTVRSLNERARIEE